MKTEAYEIHNGTYAIVAKNREESTVLAEDGCYEVAENTSSIIDYGCNYFGSTYQGRREGAITILNSRYKVPIVIEDSQNMIFFPTGDKKDQKCCWVALNKIKSYRPLGKKTEVFFENGEHYVFDISFHSFQNQVLRASRLDSILCQRKSKKTAEK